MGRIKTTIIKRTGEELYNNNKDKFSSDFTDNKKSLPGLVQVNSKKFRNVIAGYITRLSRRKPKI
jgi:small subunit ribosomal protein S17e